MVYILSPTTIYGPNSIVYSFGRESVWGAKLFRVTMALPFH